MSSGAAGRIRRAVHFFGSGVLDQVLLSAVSFLAGFVLIRFTDDEAYGQFVLANSTILLFQSAQGAWMSGPAGATAPKKDLAQRQLMLGSLGASQKRFLRRIAVALLALPAIGFLLHICTGMIAAATAATIVASWSALERGWIRSLLLIYQRPADVLQADVVYALVMGLGVAVVSRIHYAAGPCAICAMILASRAGELAARRRTDPGLRWEASAARPFWREMRPLGLWASVGAVTYWLFAQSYNYVLATRLDLTAVTAVNATRLVLMPVFVFTLGFNMLLTPVTANWLATSGAPAMLRKLALLTVAVLMGDLAYFAVMWPLRHWLITDMMRKSIADQDRLLILWACCRGHLSAAGSTAGCTIRHVSRQVDGLAHGSERDRVVESHVGGHQLVGRRSHADRSGSRRGHQPRWIGVAAPRPHARTCARCLAAHRA